MCQKTVFKRQHPCDEILSCFHDTDEDEESLKTMDSYKWLNCEGEAGC